MGQVIAFPRAERARADLGRDEILRRCRMAAICCGCNNAQRKAVQGFGERLLLEGGWTPHQIIERAKSVAEAMVHGVPPGAA